jgi:hypothetical protein
MFSKEKEMKRFIACAVTAVMMLGVTVVSAEEVKSGLQSGASVGPFNVEKLAGADTDGVSIGDNLCYRCRNGGRPQVMVFTRSTDPQVVNLIDQLDAAISKNSKKQLRAFVNYLGDDKRSATKGAKSLAGKTKAKNVPFVLPNEYENGPDNYGLNADVEVTIILAKGLKVQASHAFKVGKDVNVDAVVKDLAKILN